MDNILDKILPATLVTVYSAGAIVTLMRYTKTKDDFIPIESLSTMDKMTKRKIDKTGVKKEASTTLDEFVAKMESNGFDLSNFYRSYQPRMIVMTSHTEGFYDLEEENLIVDSSNVRRTLLRGLLDMSSTVKAETFNASGFERTAFVKGSKRELYHVGYGFNEGYKDVLLRRIFDLEGEYPRVSELVSIIEYLVGQKEAEESFIRGDLALMLNTLTYKLDTEWGYSWFRSLDSIFSAIYLANPLKKISLDRVYRKILIDLAKNTVEETKQLYLDRNENIDKMEKAKEMIHNLNIILNQRKKLPLLPGLKESDLIEISDYAEKRLSFLPRSYQIRIID